MTEHKFTDEEIKKALADWKYNLCVSCEEDDCERCVAHLLGHSLDLINRQQAKIADLEIELKAMRGAANSYKAEVERLKEQIADYELDEELRWEREVLCDDRPDFPKDYSYGY